MVVFIGLTVCAAAIGSKVYAADQIIGACAGVILWPTDRAAQPIEYLRISQAARGFARLRKVAIDEVVDGGFYALD